MKILEVNSSISSFQNVKFIEGLNLIVGDEIATKKDTSGHNVGKTSLLKVLDYAIFGRKDSEYFDAWLNRFNAATFSVLIKINDIDHSIVTPIVSKLTINNSIQKDLKESSKKLRFLFRYKTDFHDEFIRPDVKRGKDINWKPFVFEMLGYNPEVMKERLQADIDYKNTENILIAIKSAALKDQDKTEIISKKEQEIHEIRAGLKKFNYFHYEKNALSSRLDLINKEYSSLRSRWNVLKSERSNLERSLATQKDFDFNFSEIETIYKECGVLFANGVSRSFAELVDFNKTIIISRRAMLTSMLDQNIKSQAIIEPKLDEISEIRSKYLEVLARRDYKEEYESYQNRLIELEKEVSVLAVPIFKKSKEEFEQRKNILELTLAEAKVKLRKERLKDNKSFMRLQQTYSRLVKVVLNIDATVLVDENRNANIDFKVNSRQEEIELLSLTGEAFRRVSCGLFDLAYSIAFPDSNCVIVHDGIVDGLSDKIKKRYLITAYVVARRFKIQYILTSINVGLPSGIIKRCQRIVLNENNRLFGVSF